MKYKHAISKAVLYLVAGFISLLVIFPFVFTFSAAFSDRYIGISSIWDLIPKNPTVNHFIRFATDLLYLRWLLNSVLVASIVSIGKMFVDSAAGYALAKKRFFGKKAIINLCLLTLSIPFTITFLPNYYIVKNLGWINTYWALIVPLYSIPLGVFLSLQFIRTIPTELIEASRMDGCSEFGIYWRILLPVCAPLLGGLGLYYFLVSWTSFLWPLVVNTADKMKTLTVGITALKIQYSPNYSVSAAMVTLGFVPVSIFFLFMQGYFKQVIGMGVVKK